MSDSRRRKPRRKSQPSAVETARLAAGAARDMKAAGVVIIEVSGLIDYADYFVIASGRSTRQSKSIAENVLRVVGAAGKKILGLEGERDGNWILIDWGDVVVHVFHQPVREFYELEHLWGDAPRISLSDQK